MEVNVINSIRHPNNESNTRKDCFDIWKCLNNIIGGGSSIHAVSQVNQANTKSCKVFWFLILILCTCSCIFQVNNFLSIYFQFPVLIDVEVQNNRSLDFPAVTVCNLNRMKSRHIECVKEELKWEECGLLSFEVSTRTLIISERKKYTSISNVTTDQEMNYKLKSQEFFNHYTKIDAFSRQCYGQRLYELVKKCSFNSIACNYDDFTYFNSMQYGNCFTFNKKLRHDQEPLDVHKIGPNSGLELDINIYPYSYISTTSAAGSRVVIHDPEVDPNPEEQGINISPGYETQVSMFKTTVQRLPPPYRDRCKEYRSFESNETTPRNQLDCIRSCIQQTSMSLCGCVDPFLPVTQGMTSCNLKNGTQTLCLDEILEGMSENGLPCECPLPCTSTTYEIQLSTAIISSFTDSGGFDWSQDSTCEYFIRSKRERVKRLKNYFDSEKTRRRKREKVRRSIAESRAKLKVFYGSLKHTIYSQKPMFSESELYGQLGGNLSLWLGLSVVAMFEYAEKLFLLFHFCCARKRPEE